MYSPGSVLLSQTDRKSSTLAGIYAPGTGLTTSHILWHDEMPEVRKDFFFPTAEHAEIAEIRDGIYRIS